MAETLIRILVVDDERPIRRFLNASLGGQYTVLEAATGEEALSMAVSGRPDVILLDLGLPDMDGVEVTRRLREWTQIPIIVVSVRDQEENKIAALDAGADDYLTKPFGVGELTARVRGLAPQRRSRGGTGLPEGRPAGGPGQKERAQTGPGRQPDTDRIRHPAPTGLARRQGADP